MRKNREETKVNHAIHTAVPGRARFKIEGLYHCESLKQLLESRLAQTKSVKEVSANPLTGNLLLSFNSDKTPEFITSLLEQVIAEHREKESTTLAVVAPANGVSN